MSPGIHAENRFIGSIFLPDLNSLPAEIQIAMPFTAANNSHHLSSTGSTLMLLELSQTFNASSF